MSKYKILVYGYGNPGRQDDGLGNAFVDKLERWVESEKLDGFEFDSNYQLNIEDAEAIASQDLVIFVDASTEELKDYILTPVNASTNVAFTTHAASPGYIVHLCKNLYNKIPPTYLLHIKGYEWAFKEGLSNKAVKNLELSFDYMKRVLSDPKKMIEEFQEF
ncbi:MAG: hydrogenase maturation protease [Bacteroidales bacterium]|nr:hydrogenase maturation protease [Bacteroidales bacterium]MCF8403882.1 hydrogenase maturation protease [Bacteroidales bacterium]